jgi:hypothetical protein
VTGTTDLPSSSVRKILAWIGSGRASGGPKISGGRGMMIHLMNVSEYASPVDQVARNCSARSPAGTDPPSK